MKQHHEDVMVDASDGGILAQARPWLSTGGPTRTLGHCNHSVHVCLWRDLKLHADGTTDCSLLCSQWPSQRTNRQVVREAVILAVLRDR